jgi:acetoacetate decarboxylase
MRKEDVLKLPSMPAAGPSYPAGPYRFVNREYMVITYETDAQALAADLPEPLEPVETRSCTSSGSRCPTARASAPTRNPAW